MCTCTFFRQPRPPPGVSKAWFEEYGLPYGDDVYALLGEMGLAMKDADHEQWNVSQCLRAGRRRYLSRSSEFFLALIPLVSAICGSSTTWTCAMRSFRHFLVLAARTVGVIDISHMMLFETVKFCCRA